MAIKCVTAVTDELVHALVRLVPRLRDRGGRRARLRTAFTGRPGFHLRGTNVYRCELT